jgi:integrase
MVGQFHNKGLKYPKGAEKPPFQTWKEIEQQIKRGNLSEEEKADLWDCLFLGLNEIADLLVHVRTAAQQPFIYPMFVLAAHTGARRSELVRSRLVDLDDDTMVVRERKRSRGRNTTRRVPLSSLATESMRDWLKIHPGGPFTFCQHVVDRSKKSRPEAQPVTRDEAHDHFKRTLAGSKWDKLRGWHVLRHSFISNLALKAIDQRIIDSFVGHTTEEMRRRYTHLFPSAKKDAIKAVLG